MESHTCALDSIKFSEFSRIWKAGESTAPRAYPREGGPGRTAPRPGKIERRACRSAASGDFLLERNQNARGIPHMCFRFYQVFRIFPHRESSKIDRTSDLPSGGWTWQNSGCPGEIECRVCRRAASGDFILERNQNSRGFLDMYSTFYQVVRFFPIRKSRQIDAISTTPIVGVALKSAVPPPRGTRVAGLPVRGRVRLLLGKIEGRVLLACLKKSRPRSQ